MEVPTLIYGQRLSGGDVETVEDLRSPGRVVTEVRITEGSEIIRAADGLEEAMRVWRKTTDEEKSGIFSRAADILEDRKTQAFDQMNKEAGVERPMADFVFGGAVGILRDLAVRLSKGQEPVMIELGGRHQTMVVREPIGGVLAMSPWNAPPILAMRSVAYPLAAGCPVIFKTNEIAPGSQYATISCLLDAGLPAGMLNVINSTREQTPKVVEALLSHKNIRKVNFTGSSAVGSKIAQLAAKHLKTVTLELGGKGAVIVDEDADIPKAVAAVLDGAWKNAGQICMSTERVFVHERVYSKFVELLKNTEFSLNQAQPLVNHGVNAEKLIQQALDSGAQILYHQPGEQIDRIILEKVDETMDLYSQESFGPVAYVVPVKTTSEAIDLANASEYGLSCAIWSSNPTSAIAIARQLECGSVHINGNTVFDHPAVPHGGCKSSGWGRFNSQWGIDEFTFVKSITYTS
ncbi:hypothetical protein TRICI_004763 [Trichomonascus ciferrii]|uniref:Aldehyde dehydrogenase domain-containing protein n=1 Tax=Trichomonascus ciferrii TaxID=44093 RepID=A0A642UZM5_9ASCO|nr:hypothetical protein TRICI_004763 [Trichomonascus ciferrii]